MRDVEKLKQHYAKGNKVYNAGKGFWMLVKNHNGWYRANTNHDEIWFKINAELEYRVDFADAVADMVEFSARHGLQEIKP